MTEEESSTSDFDPLHFVLKQNDNIIQLQFKFMEEMKKTSLLEEKNISVQNDMKILTKDINQFMGEKEKFVTKLEEKNLSLENEINKKL
uniref:Uncharacterized protein n=1 Tax=Meloidogyne floridensis TaxID=298350 RepID=A0A915NQ70_9BILA